MVKKSVLLVVLAGWLLPAWLGFAALFGWFDLAVAPLYVNLRPYTGSLR